MVSLEGWMPPSTAGLGKDKTKQRSSGAAGPMVRRMREDAAYRE
jgi:hypothetical protein